MRLPSMSDYQVPPLAMRISLPFPEGKITPLPIRYGTEHVNPTHGGPSPYGRDGYLVGQPNLNLDLITDTDSED
jgi:hypothetical protein